MNLILRCDVKNVIFVKGKGKTVQSVLVLAKSSPISDSDLFNNTVEVAQVIKFLHFARFVQAEYVNDGTSLSLLLLIVMV